MAGSLYTVSEARDYLLNPGIVAEKGLKLPAVVGPGLIAALFPVKPVSTGVPGLAVFCRHILFTRPVL